MCIYVAEKLSDIPEKSVEPVALWIGEAPRILQEFLSRHQWDHDTMSDRLSNYAVIVHVRRLTA